MTKYRIKWRVVKTGTTGQEERVFDIRRLAQRKADTLNAAWRGDIIHEVEPVEVEEEEQGRGGGYQCPKCHLRSGEGWVDKPSSPPTCCGGVPMVPYLIPSPNQKKEAPCNPED